MNGRTGGSCGFRHASGGGGPQRWPTKNDTSRMNAITESRPVPVRTSTSVRTESVWLPAAKCPSRTVSVSEIHANSAHVGVHSSRAIASIASIEDASSPVMCTHGGQPFSAICRRSVSSTQGASGSTRRWLNERTNESSVGGVSHWAATSYEMRRVVVDAMAVVSGQTRVRSINTNWCGPGSLGDSVRACANGTVASVQARPQVSMTTSTAMTSNRPPVASTCAPANR